MIPTSFSSHAQLELFEAKYRQWKQDPASVEPSWAYFLSGFELGYVQLPGPSSAKPAPGSGSGSGSATASLPASVGTGNLSEDVVHFRGKVQDALHNFRAMGHTAAWLNPLSAKPPEVKALEPEQLGFSPADLTQEVATKLWRAGKRAPLQEVLADMRQIYCGNIGFEFMHIHKQEVREWLRERIENRATMEIPTGKQKIVALRTLMEAQKFEEFLHNTYRGQKRFSLEGAESLMVALETIYLACPRHEVAEIVMGMAHRGRLTVLANYLKKPLEVIFYEFSENYIPDTVAGDGDVKYHLGFKTKRQNEDGEVSIFLAANPSHLEAVDPVVEGQARARQRIIGDLATRKRVLPLLIHGDAAFAGQGIVAEVLNLSQLTGYRTGGTVHIVVNNQIGFTTAPADARSSDYCTDVAKMIEAPIFHVNGDDPMAVAYVANLALEFRLRFSRDAIIDIVCYRRHGHNEADEPSFTQPLMTRDIHNQRPIAFLYRDQLVSEGVITNEEADQMETEVKLSFQSEYEKLRSLGANGAHSKFSNGNSGLGLYEQPSFSYEPVVTSVEESRLLEIAHKLVELPPEFQLNSTLRRRFLEDRKKALETRQGFDWGFAETLAYATLLVEGTGIRLSGQDVRRGTFSHRHAFLYDSETRNRYSPLQNLSPDQARFSAYNSLLSEAAVLGFDYGYSVMSPDVLVLWEAQFGDFANGAQVIIDQFLVSAESKWKQTSNMVLLLPHAYEGMGPEHSSARLERFLQLCAGFNIQVANITTPAQLFHLLRRQVKRKFNKPLILMTPKSLLRHPECVSPLEDFTGNLGFQEVLDDTQLPEKAKPANVTRLIFCTGKVYYDLLEYRRKEDVANAAIIRLEQIYPIHYELLKEIVSRYPRAKKWVWCQEEPQNMGAWRDVQPRLAKICPGSLRYAGRERGASPAAGSKIMHNMEQKMLLEAAFGV